MKMKSVELYRKMITDKTKVILLTACFNYQWTDRAGAKDRPLWRNKRVLILLADSAHALGQGPFSLHCVGF
jgi:hypothetical protein